MGVRAVKPGGLQSGAAILVVEFSLLRIHYCALGTAGLSANVVLLVASSWISRRAGIYGPVLLNLGARSHS